MSTAESLGSMCLTYISLQLKGDAAICLLQAYNLH